MNGPSSQPLRAWDRSLPPLDEGIRGGKETVPSQGPPVSRTSALCLPSVRVPVAIYMPSPCAARSRTLENILMHGKNLTGRGRENSVALKH